MTTTKTSSNPLVSIIIPVYNTEKYLKDCLDSVLSQTYQNLEIILIDDGSTDNSSQILKQYAKKDSRIKIITQKNQGQSTARNYGLKEASGEYVSFIDSDDAIEKDFVSSLLSPYLKNDSVSLTVCGMNYRRLRLKTSEDVYINHLRPQKLNESSKAYILYLLAIDGRMYSSVNKLYRAKIAKTCAFDPNLNFAEDTKFVLDYLKKFPNRSEISFVFKPLYIYNFGTDSSTIRKTATRWQNWQTAYKILKKWLGNHPKTSERFWLHLVHLRWRISHLRSIRRAKQ